MALTYFKRYRMELELRGRRFDAVPMPPGYRLVAYRAERVDDHAEAKYYSFRDEIDSSVFQCFTELEGCRRLMAEISQREGFLPEATWLAEYIGPGRNPRVRAWCGTIQGIRTAERCGGIQNVGIVPGHRGRGVGTGLIAAALAGFQQAGLQRAYLEVTVQNEAAVRLYTRMGFRRTKTLYKAVELEYS